MKRIKWTLLAVVLSTTALASAPSHAKVTLDTTSAETFNTLYINATMDEQLLKDIDATLSTDSSKKVLNIFMTSQGGGLPDVALLEKKLYDIAAAQMKQMQRPLYLTIYSECASACTIFMTGINKRGAEHNVILKTTDETTFYFHGPKIMTDSGKVEKIKSDKEYLQRLREMTKEYLNNGVSQKWLVANAKYFHSGRELKIAGEKLCQHPEYGILNKDRCALGYEEIFKKIRDEARPDSH